LIPWALLRSPVMYVVQFVSVRKPTPFWVFSAGRPERGALDWFRLDVPILGG